MVIGVDESEHSFYALNWTLQHFFGPNTTPYKLVIVNAKPPPSSLLGIAGPGIDKPIRFSRTLLCFSFLPSLLFPLVPLKLKNKLELMLILERRYQPYCKLNLLIFFILSIKIWWESEIVMSLAMYNCSKSSISCCSVNDSYGGWYWMKIKSIYPCVSSHNRV